jgi:hypothetical protein
VISRDQNILKLASIGTYYNTNVHIIKELAMDKPLSENE